MLKHRVIPILLWDGDQTVQSVQFKRPLRKVGSFMEHIRVMETRNIDELIILDVEATPKKRKPLFDLIETFTKELFCPVTVGGGVVELDDIGRLIQHCGADKVAICDAALSNPKFIEKAAHKYGKQAIVGVVNAKTTDMGYFVYNGNYSDYTTFDPVSYSLELEQLGCGEILLTSIDANGKRKGYDTELIEHVSDMADVPVIANGGCGKPLDMVGAIAAGASAVAASSLFLFTEHTPLECSRTLQEAGLPARVQ